ncbi:MAG: ATP-binding cassette domain-containing protein [Microbacterium arborescens]
MSIVMRARDVSVEIGGRTVLAGIDLELRSGEVLVLVGPNGAGKSTLLSVLAGDRAPRSGSVELDGAALETWPVAERARRRSVLTQSNDVSFPFVAREVVRMGRAPWRRRPEADRDDLAVVDAIAAGEVERFADRPVTGLSGGERARVAFARAYAQECRIALLDEPTASLDIRHQHRVLDRTRQRAADGGGRDRRPARPRPRGGVRRPHRAARERAAGRSRHAPRRARPADPHPRLPAPHRHHRGPRRCAARHRGQRSGRRHRRHRHLHPASESGVHVMTPLHRLAAAAAAVLVACGAGLVAAPPAWAAASVSVATGDGSGTVAADSATAVTVSGSGFQSIRGGFGGIYVLFGWVDDAAGGSWRPSAGGAVGEDYRYVPDAETADNNGFQRFIAFPGSQTESSANGVIAADGSWSIDMVVPGATFESTDRSGAVSAVDCRQVTCGIITIGAHGVKNANNETFTPLSFGAASGPAAAADETATAAAGVGAVRVGVESARVDAGTSIVFTGQGFTPGEQVVASLDGGLTAVGPLTAGTQGEVAAALAVPRDIRDGTHLVTLRGAASGAVAEAEVTVTGGTATVAAAASTAPPTWSIVVMLVTMLVSAVLIATSIVAAIVRARARRRERRAAAAPAAPVMPARAPELATHSGGAR